MKYDKQMRDYVLKGKEPTEIHLFLYFYSYEDLIFVARNAFPVSIFKRERKEMPDKTMVSCPYFCPFAFIAAEKGTYGGIGLMEMLSKQEKSFSIGDAQWINEKIGQSLPPAWPLQVSENLVDGTDGVFGGKDLGILSSP